MFSEISQLCFLYSQEVEQQFFEIPENMKYSRINALDNTELSRKEFIAWTIGPETLF